LDETQAAPAGLNLCSFSTMWHVDGERFLFRRAGAGFAAAAA
jgi:hypothetical protein